MGNKRGRLKLRNFSLSLTHRKAENNLNNRTAKKKEKPTERRWHHMESKDGKENKLDLDRFNELSGGTERQTLAANDEFLSCDCFRHIPLFVMQRQLMQKAPHE